ncbi:MAG TPA: ornithine cyclodeaminase family protein [Stellaceae bacterium]|nr:ornithine cyclodeaminase family protein [Stellaceae bacterium]
MPLVLKASEVAPLLDLKQAVTITEAVFREQATGAVEVHPPYHLHVDKGSLRVVSAALKGSDRMGLRFGPASGLTSPRGIESHLAALYATDGELLSVMGYPFATLRTGATVAVAVKHMAPEAACRVGLIGTGMNALSLLEGVQLVRPVAEVAVYSRDEDRRKTFAAAAERALGLPVRPVAEPREAVSARDIVLTATNFRQPLFPFDWLDDGAHVASMGPIGEIAEEVFLKASHVVVSCKEHEKHYLYPMKPFPLVDLIAEGKLHWDDVDELGDVVAGRPKAQRQKRGTTLFHESAGGFGDVAFAAYVYSEARRRGLGQEVSF